MELPFDYKHKTIEAWGGKYRFGFSPIGKGYVYWFAVEKTRAGGRDEENPVARLKSKFEFFNPLVEEIIGSTKSSKVIRNDLYDLNPISKWHKGRVMLIGDAAHATTPNLGQGGAQAIIDGWTLAKVFEKNQDYQQVFETFQSFREKTTSRVVRNSRLMGRTAHIENKSGQAFRNALFRLIPEQLNYNQLLKLYQLKEP